MNGIKLHCFSVDCVKAYVEMTPNNSSVEDFRALYVAVVRNVSLQKPSSEELILDGRCDRHVGMSWVGL